jgi:hypothetical protein
MERTEAGEVPARLSKLDTTRPDQFHDVQPLFDLFRYCHTLPTKA